MAATVLRWVCVLAAACRSPAPAPTPGSSVPRPVAAGLDPAAEARLARLERKVDRVAAAVDRLLGPQIPDETTVFAVPLDPRDLVEGPADAKVTIVVAFELMDEATQHTVAVIDQVRAKHPNEVRVAWRYFAVHGPPAIAAGIVACASGSAWPQVRAKLLDTLYAGNVPHPERSNLDALAPLVPAAQLAASRAACERWATEAAKGLPKIGLATPPGVVINGRVLPGSLDPERIDNLVNQEIAKATAAIGAGTPAARYYDVVVAGGRAAVQPRFED